MNPFPFLQDGSINLVDLTVHVDVIGDFARQLIKGEVLRMSWAEGGNIGPRRKGDVVLMCSFRTSHSGCNVNLEASLLYSRASPQVLCARVPSRKVSCGRKRAKMTKTSLSGIGASSLL